MTSPIEIFPGLALAHLEPDFLATLTTAELAVLPYMYDVWMRPEQRIPSHDWRSLGFICGRGFGKSMSVGVEINRRVKAGEVKSLALQAPNEDRVDEVQIEFLIATSPPWFRAERYNGSIVWPNGVSAEVFTPEAPGRSRSGNFDLSWMCEIVDWQESTRKEAFDNLTTATRVGRAQYIWDTTSKGQNDVIQHLLAMNALDPRAYPIVRGTTFDNPLLTRKYLQDEAGKYSGRQLEEELLGRTYNESAGALWKQEWIDAHRVAEALTNPELRLAAIDPGLSKKDGSDECGFIVGSRRRGDGHSVIEEDHTARMAPEEWGDLAVAQHLDNGAAGCVVERNHLGDNATFVIRSRAKERTWNGKPVTVHVLDEKDKAFPARTPGRIYVREVVAASSKTTRAGAPAAETEAGRVHVVGKLPKLEKQWVTFEPGSRKSPNNYDAAAYLIIELQGLGESPKPAPSDAIRVAQEMAKKFAEQNRGRMGRLGI
jgi:phage terminase large subunit-like protein